ncbi:MAG TPA: LapA family protein [Pseudolabrys sp.]|nr:LapA family protein [Pseudolabrys sp.]
MFRKIVTAIIVVPLVAVIVAFAVANRQAVTVSFDPFSSASPAYAATLPLFAIIFAVLILGVLIGGIAAWIGQRKWRRAARRLDGEVRALHDEMETVRRRFGTSEQAVAPREPVPLPVLPGPIP